MFSNNGLYPCSIHSFKFYRVTTSNSDARPHAPNQYVLRHAKARLTCCKATMQGYAPNKAYLGRFEVRSKTTLMVTVCIHCLIRGGRWTSKRKLTFFMCHNDSGSFHFLDLEWFFWGKNTNSSHEKLPCSRMQQDHVCARGECGTCDQLVLPLCCVLYP